MRIIYLTAFDSTLYSFAIQKLCPVVRRDILEYVRKVSFDASLQPTKCLQYFLLALFLYQNIERLICKLSVVFNFVVQCGMRTLPPITARENVV